MSRSYTQIYTAIWRDPSFVNLDVATQRALFLLGSQGNISAAGVLPLTLRRWAKLASNTAAADVLAGLRGLHEVGLVVLDEDTEEVWVRSFISDDNGYRNPRRLPAIRDAALAVESELIREALAVELARLGCSEWMGGGPLSSDSHTDSHSDSHTEEDGAGEHGPPNDLGAPGGPGSPERTATGEFPQVNSHNDSQTSIDGMAIDHATARTSTPIPQPLYLNPQPTTPKPPSSSPAGAKDEPEREDVEKICAYLAKLIVQNGNRTPTITKRWRTEARLLIDRDKRTPKEICDVIRWCQQDTFWKTNILSMPKLREKYDQLRGRMEQDRDWQDRQSGTLVPAGYPDRSGIATRNGQGRVAAEVRKARGYLDMAAELDAQYARRAAG